MTRNLLTYFSLGLTHMTLAEQKLPIQIADFDRVHVYLQKPENEIGNTRIV